MERSFPCPYNGCTSYFVSAISRDSHHRHTHEFTPRPCPACLDDPHTVYPDDKALRQHRDAVHNSFPELMACPLGCDKGFLYRRIQSLRHHLRYVHHIECNEIDNLLPKKKTPKGHLRASKSNAQFLTVNLSQDETVEARVEFSTADAKTLLSTVRSSFSENTKGDGTRCQQERRYGDNK